MIDAASTTEESHRGGLVEYPQYTRPPVFRGLDVPAVLLSGHHADIARWRRDQAIRRTARLRPDLLARERLSPREQALADSVGTEPAGYSDDPESCHSDEGGISALPNDGSREL